MDPDGVPTGLEDIPFDADDIGVFLMESITKGLYKNPMNVLREYISNEIDNDERPTRIRVQVGPNRVDISGDGPGMDRKAARVAVRVGYSPKDPTKNIGFRGIGIYSGVAICQKIILSTKKQGDSKTLVIVIDAAGLRDDFQHRSKISLVASLKSNVRWRDVPAPSGTEGAHGTAVSLIGLDASASHLCDEDVLRPYLQNAIPLKLDPKFPSGAKIDAFLKSELGDDYRPISLVLGTAEIFRSPNIGELEAAHTGPILHEGEKIGCYWFCQNVGRGKIENADFRGLILRKKGFAIGDRTTVQNLFETDANLVDWVTGEIHVTSQALVPDTERVALEDGPMKTSLETWISGELGGKISDLSREKSAIFRADGRITQAEEIVAEGVPSTHEEWYAQLSRAIRILDGLERDRKTKFALSIRRRIEAAHQRLESRVTELRSNPIPVPKTADSEPEPEEEVPKPSRPVRAVPPRGPPTVTLPPDVSERVRSFCYRLGSPSSERMIRAIVMMLLEKEVLADPAAAKRFLQEIELRISG